LRKRAADAARLEEENGKLKAQLTKRDAERERDASDQLLTPAPVRSRLSTRTPASDADEVDWKRQAAINGVKYSRINAEFQKAKDALVRLKEDRDSWKECAEKREKKIKTLEARNRTFSGSSAPLPAEIGIATKESSYSPPPGDQGESAPSSLPARPIPANPELWAQQETSSVELPPPKPTSDSSDAPEHIQIKQEPSSDPPVVVSERPVRKRKRDETEMHEADSRRVKREETNSSDPVIAADVCNFSPVGTLDLDEPSARIVDTPRKRRLYDAAGLAESIPRPALNILQDRDPNMQGCRARDAPLKRGISRAVASVAEDGVVYKTIPASRKLSNAGGDAPRIGKLRGLLDEPQPAVESPVIRSGSRESGRREMVVDEHDHFIRPRQLPFDKASRKVSKQSATDKAGQTPSRPAPSKPPDKGRGQSGDISKTPATPATPATRLRLKPMSELRLDDFKINPKYNNGYKYAFSEVVRNRDERSKLPGCVDTDCCGPGFRELALAERGTGPRTPEQQTEDKKLLERYLGDEAYRLFSMTKEEKDGIWVRAKAQEIADRSGKHRHQFTRMKSPPGFWRTDFPSTQEIAEEKAEALRREKETISERYRHALRSDGRWKFRDE
jgi:hypothetical protein